MPVHNSQVIRNPSDLSADFWAALMSNEGAASTILSFAKKVSHSPHEAGDGQLWIIQYDITGEQVEFILSCTRGLLGDYPIFVFTPKSSAELTRDGDDGWKESLSQLVRCLLQEVDPKRVFAVFAITCVAETFSDIMHRDHGIQRFQNPYYDALLTFCTRETLENPPPPYSSPDSEGVAIALRPADMTHLEALKALCKAFSDTSPPYRLDDQGAEKEARALITNKEVWVHMIKRGDQDWDMACLVAMTRQSENVTAITKVFTAERWRSRGCAARLMHRVCQELLQKKERVVLFVGAGAQLAPARTVYGKVGFKGMGQQEQRVEGVERYLEIGFEGSTLGHW